MTTQTTGLELCLKWFLRIMGTSALSALVFVAAPYFWMGAIHQWLGLGRLPSEPVVGCLARSTSWFYALQGDLAWVVSFDLRRFRPVLIYLGAASAVFGVALGIVDWAEGLPRWWWLGEGLGDALLGLFIFVCACRIPRDNETKTEIQYPIAD